MTTAAETHTPSRACYQRGCRLPECALEDYRYRKQIQLEHSRGRRRQASADQPRIHVHRLHAASWNDYEIARASGVCRSTIANVSNGQPTVRNWVALAILSVPIGPPPAPQKPEVDATGSIRRLRALAVIGHPFRTVAPFVGCSADKLWLIARGSYETVNADTAAGIARAYKALATKPGTSPISRARAVRRNWHGPLAWDDIDDPNCKPEEAKSYKPADKYRRDPDRTREIEHLYLLGESPQQIAKKVGGNEKYISDQLNAVIAKRAAKAERERLAAKRQRKQVAA